MKIIDKYILKKFLGTFLYTISLVIVIVIIFDVSEKVDDFIEGQAPLRAIIFDYYLNFVPFFVNMFSPLFTFIAVIFFTSKMAYRSEIVAILNSGMSFRRMLAPYLFSATIIAAFSLYLNNYIIPHTNKERLAFEETYIRNTFRNLDNNIHREINPGTFIYFNRYDNIRNIGYKFSLERFKDGMLNYKIISNLILWDSVSGKWQIEDYYIREIDGEREKISTGLKLDTVFSFQPGDFSRRTNTVEMMDYRQLNDFIGQEQTKGAQRIEFYLIEKYKRFAFPFATLILTLIGVTVSSRKAHGGTGLHIGLGLVIAFSYILFMQVSVTFATNANTPPAIAVWIPNILYSILALYLLRIAPK